MARIWGLGLEGEKLTLAVGVLFVVQQSHESFFRRLDLDDLILDYLVLATGEFR
ncbi:MAG: hypothetical protein ACI9G1_006123 [Pirellulaceae bacterium]|jgi:hypothetical protein